MLAFELPPSELINIEYVGLAQSTGASEMQKDILRQALAELLPAGRELVDVNENPNAEQSAGLYLRCIQCDGKFEYTPSSIKVIEEDKSKANRGSSKSQFKIAIAREGKAYQTWNVEIGVRKVAWYFSLKADSVSPSTRLTSANFQMTSCIEGINCPQTRTFSNQIDCKKSIESLAGRRVDTPALQAIGNKERFVTTEKIPFQNDVKSQAQVRATLLSQNSSFTIKTSAKALKNGSIGDIIPIEITTPSYSLNKTRLLDARIVGEGEVELVR
ncbi:hypothetical protein EBU99_06230 [bacterium]|nr:hypothetical protein [bacterium]